jgi:photosystem II stability/assembly factor-like uncharacterized protein
MAPLAAKTRLLDIEQAGSRLVAVGQQGVIVVSDDGKQWRQVPSPVSQMLNRVRFLDEKTGWITGYDGVILKTGDGGETWTLKNFNPAARALFDVMFLDSSNAIAIGGYGTYLTSSDGGESWAERAHSIRDLGLHLITLIRLGDGSLFIAGEKGFMARSADNGENWQFLDGPYTGSYFGALPRGDKGVLLFGLRGNVYTTADVSLSPSMDPSSWDEFARVTITDPEALAKTGWQFMGNEVRESLFGGSWVAEGQGVLVGVNGTTVKTDFGSGKLLRVKTPAEETLGDVIPYQGRLIAVGRRGVQDLGSP